MYAPEELLSSVAPSSAELHSSQADDAGELRDVGVVVDVGNIVHGYNVVGKRWRDEAAERLVRGLVTALRERFPTASIDLFAEVSASSWFESIGRDADTHPTVTEAPDREMLARIAQLRTLPNLALLVIVSGDSVFQRVLDDAKRAGLRTQLIADPSDASPGLLAAADEWLDINDLVGLTPRATADTPDHEAPSESSQTQLLSEREHVSWLDDEPVNEDADELGRLSVAKALEHQLRALVGEGPADDGPQRSFLVHVDGPWGAGKSTLMRFVQDQLEGGAESDVWLVVNYDAWRQSRSGPPWLTLLEAIRTGLRAGKATPYSKFWFWLRERSRLVAGWQWISTALVAIALLSVIALLVTFASGFTLSRWGDVAKLAGAAFSGIAAVWVFASWVGRFATLNSDHAAKVFTDSRADPMEQLARHFRWMLNQAGRPVVLMIDDLDRCPEDHVVETLETVQKLLRDHTTASPEVSARKRASLIILVAADGRWVRASYDNTYAGLGTAVSEPGASVGSLFVQKLFQLSVPVPRLSEALKARYVADILADHRGDRPPRSAVSGADLAERIHAAPTSDEVRELLANADPLDRITAADAAIQRLVLDDDAQVATRHLLEPFAVLVDSTPRSLKRYVMTFSMLRAVRTAEGSNVDPRLLALWTALITRWPTLGDYLQRYPESVALFAAPHSAAAERIPRELISLFTEPPNELKTLMNHPAGPMDEHAIRACSGQ
ncbi:P-loop NTPase fold protein (plasmid) [Mycolicibacterium aichiense]|uniref:P-loop NTPase fold protein n=1 Tax=Mycolicibacterium aichiense TaxID=1799 RepID=UPI003D666D00